MDRIVYELQRLKRRSVTIRVAGGKVFVKAPYYVALDKIEEFIFLHEKWIRSKLALEAKTDSEYSDIQNYENILVEGLRKKVLIGQGVQEEDVWCFKDFSALRKFMEKEYGKFLIQRSKYFSEQISVCPAGISLRDFKACWGNCDKNGKIKLNWRLVMLPESLQDYVLVHELCHILHLNHSSAFWNEVGKILPDYKQRRKKLKEYSFLTLLYRN